MEAPSKPLRSQEQEQEQEQEKDPTAGRSRDAAQSDYPEDFEALWTLYPKRLGDNPKRRAYRAYAARRKEGSEPDVLRAGVERYAAFVRARGQEHTEFVKQAATFFGPEKSFLEPWTVSGAVDPIAARNAAATAGWTPPPDYTDARH